MAAHATSVRNITRDKVEGDISTDEVSAAAWKLINELVSLKYRTILTFLFQK